MHCSSLERGQNNNTAVPEQCKLQPRCLTSRIVFDKILLELLWRCSPSEQNIKIVLGLLQALELTTEVEATVSLFRAHHRSRSHCKLYSELTTEVEATASLFRDHHRSRGHCKLYLELTTEAEATASLPQK